MPQTSTLLPRAEVVHQLPGRLRLRVPGRRGEAGFFAELAARLAQLAGVHGVRANHRTGSVLIAHAGAPDELRRIAREADLLEITPADAPPMARAQAYSQRLARLPAISLAAAGLTGLGAVQVARGRILGSATENFWMAFRIYALMGRPRIAALLILLGFYRLVQGEPLGSAESLFWYAAQANRMAKRQGGAV